MEFLEIYRLLTTTREIFDTPRIPSMPLMTRAELAKLIQSKTVGPILKDSSASSPSEA